MGASGARITSTLRKQKKSNKVPQKVKALCYNRGLRCSEVLRFFRVLGCGGSGAGCLEAGKIIWVLCELLLKSGIEYKASLNGTAEVVLGGEKRLEDFCGKLKIPVII
jgi:hypothetical protein